jgi:hypothetical protein
MHVSSSRRVTHTSSGLAIVTRTLTSTLFLVVGVVGVAGARPERPVPSRAVPRATGVTFTSRTTSSSADKRTREATANVATVRMQDGNVRMDYVEGMTPSGQKGGYLLVQGATGNFFIVNPKEKQAIKMTADGMGSGLGAMLNNPMLKMTISNVSFRFIDLGAGESILGYKTRKVRTYYNSTVETKVLMITNKMQIADSTDQWIANVDFDPQNLEIFAKSFSSGVKSTNPDLAIEMAKYTKEYGRKGLALKRVTWSTITDKKGNVKGDTVTTEISDLKTGSLDASIFEVPKDYEIADMTQMAAGLQAAMDSAKADTSKGAKKADKKEDKPQSAGDAIKAGIGGLFGRKKAPTDTTKKPPM